LIETETTNIYAMLLSMKVYYFLALRPFTLVVCGLTNVQDLVYLADLAMARQRRRT
jgi:hypothetical protein